MRTGPSIVPGTPEDYYLVINHYGRHGTAFAETDIHRADYETTIADLMFNPETDRSDDVSHAVVQDILRRLSLGGDDARRSWKISSIVMPAGIFS